jgi:hypothetical protein
VKNTALEDEFKAIASELTGHLTEMERLIDAGEVTNLSIIELTYRLRTTLHAFTEARKEETT